MKNQKVMSIFLVISLTATFAKAGDVTSSDPHANDSRLKLTSNTSSGANGGKAIGLSQEPAGSKGSMNPRFIKKNTRIWWIAPKQGVPPRTEKPADELRQNWLTYIKQTESIIPKPTRIVTRPTRIWWISIKPADRINTSTMKPVTSEMILLNSTGINGISNEMASEPPTKAHSTDASNDDPTSQILDSSVGATHPEPTEATLITTSIQNPVDVNLMTESEIVTESTATEAVTGLALDPAGMDSTKNSNWETESILPTDDQVTQSVDVADGEVTKFGESAIADPVELSGLDDEGPANDKAQEMNEHSGPTETSELISSTHISSDEPDQTTNLFESGAESSSTQPDDSDFVNVEGAPVTESPTDSSETANVEQTTDRDDLGPTSDLPLSATQVNDSEELCDAFDFTGSQSETSDPPSADATVASDQPHSSESVGHTSESSGSSDLIVFSYTGTSQDESVGATESIDLTTFSDVDETTGPPTATEPKPFTSEDSNENFEDLPNCHSFLHAFCATIQTDNGYKCLCMGNVPVTSLDEANTFCRNFSNFGRPPMSLVSFPTENDLEWIALTFSIICPKCRLWTAGTCHRQLIPSDANNPNLFSVSSSNYFWNSPWGQPVARSMYCNDQIRPDNCGLGNSLILTTNGRYCLQEVNETNQIETYALCW